MFWKKSWFCVGNYNLPYKKLKFKVSMFSLMFAFSRFLTQNTNIPIQPVLNLKKNGQKKWFARKVGFVVINYNLPYKTLTFSVQVSMFSLMFAFSRFLAQNANILVHPVLILQKNWSK